MVDDRFEIAKLADETTRKALEQTQRIVGANAAVNERAGAAGAEIIRHSAEAVQVALLSGVRAVQRSLQAAV